VSTFEEAVEAIKENKAISQDEQLALYGLYKQANIGDVNIERPGMLNMSGKAKWDAWKKEEGKTNDEAKAAYVTLVGELNAKYA
jgi:diazepam-binding inhibitor (GABA receptor modulating acyl-CoA-binding protein)